MNSKFKGAEVGMEKGIIKKEKTVFSEN